MDTDKTPTLSTFLGTDGRLRGILARPVCGDRVPYHGPCCVHMTRLNRFCDATKSRAWSGTCVRHWMAVLRGACQTASDWQEDRGGALGEIRVERKKRRTMGTIWVGLGWVVRMNGRDRASAGRSVFGSGPLEKWRLQMSPCGRMIIGRYRDEVEGCGRIPWLRVRHVGAAVGISVLGVLPRSQCSEGEAISGTHQGRAWGVILDYRHVSKVGNLDSADKRNEALPACTVARIQSSNWSRVTASRPRRPTARERIPQRTRFRTGFEVYKYLRTPRHSWIIKI